MIVVFPLGITLLYCRLLWVDRKKIMLPIEERERDFELMAEAFLFEPYKVRNCEERSDELRTH